MKEEDKENELAKPVLNKFFRDPFDFYNMSVYNIYKNKIKQCNIFDKY